MAMKKNSLDQVFVTAALAIISNLSYASADSATLSLSGMTNIFTLKIVPEPHSFLCRNYMLRH